ncbi:OTU domain-containing protein [Pseudomonas sp. UV AK001]|uniref:OTU domain-containing protein n=1 Tax=Pseudomonas sp. UV AK001 TaxID=3384791 RepID=UPI0038D42E51
MSEFLKNFKRYYDLLESMELEGLYRAKVNALYDNNAHSLTVLEQMLLPGTDDLVYSYTQFHCSHARDPVGGAAEKKKNHHKAPTKKGEKAGEDVESLWTDENAHKRTYINVALARAEFERLHTIIERTTIAVLMATIKRHNLQGQPHQAFQNYLLRIWDKKFSGMDDQMQVHSSHLGLTPAFAHGPLVGNSVLAGMIGLTENHADSWHLYKFNVCLIKVADTVAQKDRDTPDRLFLVTQNNRSCFTHGVSRVPPLVFKLLSDDNDLTANFRKVKYFFGKTLSTVEACEDNPFTVDSPDKKIMSLNDAATAKISSCITHLWDAYCKKDPEAIKALGRAPAYTHACLEKTTDATFTKGNKSYQVRVPCGLYQHGGPLTLGTLADLERQWKIDPERYPPVVDGLLVERVADDGHCMFSAIGLRVGQSASQLRELAARHISENLGLIENQENPDQYVNNLRNTEGNILWGGEPELNALARELNRAIVIHRDGQASFSILPGDRGVPPGDDIHIYYCSIEGRGGPLNHYNGLRQP